MKYLVFILLFCFSSIFIRAQVPRSEAEDVHHVMSAAYWKMWNDTLQKAIDHGIDMPNTTDGAFSGLIVEYDGTKPYESKITKITLSDGTPLEDEKTYRVVTNDFVFGGGDGYDFSGATNVSMTIPIRDVLVAAIEKAKTITPKKVDYIKDISK